MQHKKKTLKQTQPVEGLICHPKKCGLYYGQSGNQLALSCKKNKDLTWILKSHSDFSMDDGLEEERETGEEVITRERWQGL